ncbi:HAD family hydrolase [Gayadomonas joobiniege]|uniref:HAD family hydrolase n=1 Tax=Gayadomonas joobiniege TaxID=1234606 RepID=UPI000363FDCA|nr:HAD-IA family hydrolase [Gayadomonas joobiniege]
MSQPSHPFKVICFDLGGVLIDISGAESFLKDIHYQGKLADFWYEWLLCPAVKQFESGQIDAQAFVEGVVAYFKLSVSAAAFKASYTTWVRGSLEGAEALLDELKGGYQIACLSNTNTLHWPDVEATGLLSRIDHVFTSFELGAVKPDLAIYQKMLKQLNVPAHQVYFIDDNQINVDAAREAGLHAHKAVGIEAVRAVLAFDEVI